MKLTVEEFAKKYSDGDKKITDNDELLVELLEDVSDSLVNNSEEINALKSQIEAGEIKYNELLERYKSRFMNGASETEEKEDVKVEGEPEVEEVIDIKEI